MNAAAAAPAVTHLLYLHGFRSSPQSTKATKVGAWIAAHRPDVAWWCPQLAVSPAAAMRDVFAGIADWPRERTGIIGSSLGGFYATVVAERHGGRAVVLNPAVPAKTSRIAAAGETASWGHHQATSGRCAAVQAATLVALVDCGDERKPCR